MNELSSYPMHERRAHLERESKELIKIQFSNTCSCGNESLQNQLRQQILIRGVSLSESMSVK